MLNIINKMQEDLKTIENEYMYQLLNEDTLNKIRLDCDIVLNEANLSFEHCNYNIKAILNDVKFKDNGGIVNAYIDFVDTRTNKTITDMEQLLNITKE